MRPLIGDLTLEAARCFRDETALVFPGVRTLTYREVDELAGRFAGGLAERGLSAGDRIVLYLPNSWQWVVAYYAIARLGAVLVPANILLSVAEVSYLVTDSGARCLITTADRMAQTRVLLDRAIDLSITSESCEGACSIDELLQSNWQPPVSRSPDDLWTIGYTSGTTGKPKGAMLTHRSVFTSTAMTATIHVRKAADRVLSALPFAHVYGNVVMNSIFLTGARLIAPARFDVAESLRLIAAERITLFEGVPTMYYQMLAHPDIASADLSSLERCTVGGQTMPVAKLNAVTERFGCPMLELWGMTEVAGPAITHSPYWPPRHGSIGLPVPTMEVRVVDLEEPQRCAPTGEPGELMVRGPLVMQGYWNNPAATRAVLNDAGWLATGDIATVQDDGYVFIVDRKKDLIITAGYKVYPAELEQVIAMHPAVAMVAVTGIPDEEKGELAHAFVVPRNAGLLDEADLLAHCRRYLAAYKVPRRVIVVSDLPKTSTGKVMRRALRERGSAD